MRTIWWSILAPLALAALTPQGDYSLAGTVKNPITGEPIKGAVVVLTRVEYDQAIQPRPEPPDSRTTMAGSGGEYGFAGLTKGQYVLMAQKPGFVTGQYESGGPEIYVVNVPYSGSGLAIELTPLGAIEGTIANQYGDPLRNVTVALYENKISDGARTVTSHVTRVTNDLGQFRFWDLQPGKYYVKAVNRAGGTRMFAGTNSIAYDSWEGFRPVYFGGATNIEAATPVAVEAGTEARADFKLPVEATYKIRGTLENFTPNQTVVFQLFEGGDNPGDARVSLNGSTGRFAIDDVPAGQYTLRATQEYGTRGEVRVTVNGGDTNGVSIGLAPGVSVRATLHVDGPLPEIGTAQPPQQVQAGAVAKFCEIFLQTAGENFPLMGMTQPGQPEFTIPNVFPGRYPVRLNCTGGYVASAVSGGSDLLAEPVLTVSMGIAPPPIEIVMKTGGGAVHAKAPIPASRLRPALLLVPAFPSTGPFIFGAMEDDDETAGFNADHLGPGDYMAYALADAEHFEYRNPAVLRNLTGGTSVRVEENKTSEIALTGEVK